MFWDRGWFCVAVVVGEDGRGCKLWGSLDPVDGSGDENVPTGRGQPELSVGQRTGFL